ncbi:hypothetical protein [Nocardioides alpinus]|uniref:hypothetical protein n=1 Tax=Nocardioides alpinus TaxID=748909 RepID=UPI001113CF51|nr:hypothetical protein [Nocardioides alpinus]
MSRSSIEPAAPRTDPGPPPAVVAPSDDLPLRTTWSRRAALVAGVAGTLVLLAGAALLLRPVETGADVAAATTPRAEATPGEFDPPVVLAPDDEYVETAVVDDDLLVTHWISTTTPMDRFTVRAPRSPGLADFRPDLEDLVVAADGNLVDVGGVSLDVPGVLPSAERLYVRYRLAGALQRNSSVADRALATVTAMDIGLQWRSLPRTQSFPGGRVMTLACLAPGARAVPESCGTYVEGAWQVRSPAGNVPVTVIAQFDLAVVR